MDSVRLRVSLLDTLIDKVDNEDAARRIHDFLRSGKPEQIITVNLDFLRLCTQDPTFRNLINTASLVVPDGMPLVWAARLLGDPLPERVAGVDLVVECARLAAEHGYSIYLLGAAPGVADKAASVLCERFPGLRIAGTHSPPGLSDDDDAVTVDLIRAAAPDMLFVAFGAPRQDQWIRKHMQTLGVPVCIGVGGTFDMLSGRVGRAPEWMQRGGLEWLYRFMREPDRLFKRYFVQDLPVFLRLMLQSAAGSTGRPVPAMLPAGPTMDGGEAVAPRPGSVLSPQETVQPAA